MGIIECTLIRKTSVNCDGQISNGELALMLYFLLSRSPSEGYRCTYVFNDWTHNIKCFHSAGDLFPFFASKQNNFLFSLA